MTCTDTTAPTVNNTTPLNAATDVALNTTITATFSEDIFSTTVDNSSFTLSSAAESSGAVSFDSNTNIATFTPDSSLALLTNYTATLNTTITDLAGNPLTSNYNWSFTTVDGSCWGSAVLIETDNTGNADEPAVAFDPSNNAMAIWQQSDGSRDNIWANRYVEGSGWDTAEMIETDNAGDARNAQIAIDASGNAIAVWEQDDSTRDNIWANRYSADTGWSTAELIETDNTNNADIPDIAVDSKGKAISVWQQNDGSRNNIQANRFE